MSPGIAAATGHRVLLQLRNDRRTVALLLVVPAVHKNDTVADRGQDAPVFRQFAVQHEFGRQQPLSMRPSRPGKLELPITP